MKTDIAQFLTPKQKLFCDEYLTDRNATRAALRAGYSASTALNGQLMAMPKIKLYLQQRTEEMAQQVQVNHEMVLRELCKIAFGNMGNYFADDGKLKPMHELSSDDQAALSSVSVTEGCETIKIKMYNKLAALDKIAKHLNFYKPEEKKPEKVYVYLNKEDMTEDDWFEDEDEEEIDDDETLEEEAEEQPSFDPKWYEEEEVMPDGADIADMGVEKSAVTKTEPEKPKPLYPEPLHGKARRAAEEKFLRIYGTRSFY